MCESCNLSEVTESWELFWFLVKFPSMLAFPHLWERCRRIHFQQYRCDMGLVYFHVDQVAFMFFHGTRHRLLLLDWTHFHLRLGRFRSLFACAIVTYWLKINPQASGVAVIILGVPYDECHKKNSCTKRQEEEDDDYVFQAPKANFPKESKCYL